MRTRFGRIAGAVAAGLVLVLVPACGDDDDTSSTTTTDETTASTASSTTTTSDEEPTEVGEVRAYFLRDEAVGPVAREATGDEVAAAAMEGLLEGPTADEQQLGFSTVIPDGTELLGVTIAGGVATVDLSEQFGSGGGTASMMGRVAQVVFTLTQFPTVESVAFEIEGTPVTALGGEGLIIEEPQTRADWEDLSPSILIESPLPFTDVSSPMQITGTANTFEAMFHINVTDGEGLIVYDDVAMATSGSGTRGTFDVSVTFEVPREGVGSVILFEDSAEDGEPIHIVEVPVRISG